MIKVNISNELKQGLKILAQQEGFNDLEECIIHILTNEVKKDWINNQIKRIVQNFLHIDSGKVFTIMDLLKLEEGQKISIHIVQEAESLFEYYLDNLIGGEVEILFLDTKTLMNVYLKK